MVPEQNFEQAFGAVRTPSERPSKVAETVVIGKFELAVTLMATDPLVPLAEALTTRLLLETLTC